jgi:hypothetical protein
MAERSFTEWALGSGYNEYPNTARTITQFVIALAAAIGTHVGSHLFFGQFTSFYHNLKQNKRDHMPVQIVFTQNFTCMLWSALFFVCYSFGIYELYSTPELRWRGRSEWIEWGLLAHCAYSVYEEALYIFYGKPFVFHIHHFVVLYNYSISLICGQMQFWAAWDGTVEVTNVPLCLMIMSQLADVKVHPVISVVLWLQFLVFRIIGMGAWLYFFFVDVKHCDWETVPGILIWAVVPSTVFLWVLSNVWFVKLTKGTMKTLGLIKPTAKKEKKAE